MKLSIIFTIFFTLAIAVPSTNNNITLDSRTTLSDYNKGKSCKQALPKCKSCTAKGPGYTVCCQKDDNYYRTNRDLSYVKQNPKASFSEYCPYAKCCPPKDEDGDDGDTGEDEGGDGSSRCLFGCSGGLGGLIGVIVGGILKHEFVINVCISLTIG